MSATGNPILDNPTLKAAMMAQMQPQAPPPAPIVFPPGGAAPVPSIPAATPPTVFSTTGKVTGPGANAPRGTLLGDQTELSRNLTSGSGISQIGQKIESSGFGQKHPVLGKVLGIGAQGLAELGDIGLSSVAPRVAAEIPGTELHHNLQVRRDQGQLAEDTANEGKQALTQKTLADIPYEQAQTENLQHPPATPLETSEGYYGFNPRTGEVTPIKGQNGEPLQPFVKPGNRQHVVLEDPAHPGNAMLGFVDPITGETTNAEGAVIPNPKPFEKPTNPQHITVMHDGKPHVMGSDAEGNFTRDLGEAPPNYAQMMPLTLPTHTTELLGPDNVMHRYQYNPQTRQFDIDMGPAPTGTAAHQIFQGAAIEQLAPQLISDINANRKILGNLSSYYKQWLAGTPVSDPNAAQLMTELMSFAAMQPALHAFRSTSALDAFEKMVGGLSKNPDSTIATINGLLKTPQAFTGVAHKGASSAPNAPKVGTVVDGYKFKGGNPADQKNWEEVKK